jgi:hypothetical protein
LRQRAAYTLSDQYYMQYQRTADGDLWKQAALGEIWLARPVAVPPKTFVRCQATVVRPVLDGVLSDPCWQDADVLRLKAEHEEVNDIDSSFPLAMISYDSEFLYLAASIPRHSELPSDRPIREGRTHDADVSKFDRLSLFLDIDRDYATWYALHIDQRGWTAESCWGDVSWNPKWFVAADADETHWRIEAAIPMKELAPQPPGFNTVWGVGIVRTLPAVGVQSWTQPAGTAPRPESFGLVKFD